MNRKRILIVLLVLLAVALSGCTGRNIEEMYALPKRSQEYQHLENALEEAMAVEGLEYCAPVAGENQQSVQKADLNGDGVEEYLVFTSGGAELSLQVLIFQQDPATGVCSLMDVIQSSGTAFEQVEYVNFDEKPGLELVIGRQVSDQVLRSVSVYNFSAGTAEMVLMNGYAKFITCDLDRNSRSELLVFRPGEASAERGMAVLYSTQKGKIQRSVEMELSANTSQIRRITRGRLQDGSRAIYVSSVVGEKSVVTDVFSMQKGQFSNVSYNGQTGASVETLKNFYVYPEDIDGDGVLELPSLVSIKPVSFWAEDEQKYLLRWYAMDGKGKEVDKLYTFHDYMGGWYVELDSEWAERVTVEQEESEYTFYVWDETYESATAMFTIYLFSGSTRDADVAENGRFLLHRGEGVSYAAKLEWYADQYGITEHQLIDSFSLIRQDWRTGDI